MVSGRFEREFGVRCSYQFDCELHSPSVVDCQLFEASAKQLEVAFEGISAGIERFPWKMVKFAVK
jgi:hypothetical protein